MPNIFHQSVEDILKAATPEQRLIWNYIFLRWGERVAISQLVLYGNLTGSELFTYSPNKLYFAYQINTESQLISQAFIPSVIVYNELNASVQSLTNLIGAWDATAAAMRYGATTGKFNNILFSRVANNALSASLFIGYRIGI